MGLSAKQQEFSRAVEMLLQFMHDKGYEVTFGDAYRDPRSHGKSGDKLIDAKGKKVYGRKFSNHKIRLAIDLNLFKDDIFLQGTEDHRKCGEFWESIHIDARWGGHYNDGNHYSFEHNGRQ